MRVHVVRCPEVLRTGRVVGVDEGDVRQRALFGRREELVLGIGDVVVLLRGVELRHRLAPGVVAGGQFRVAEAVEDRHLQVRRALASRRREEPARVDVGGRGQLVEAVGPGRPHQRAVVGVEKRVATGQSAEDRHLRLFVVADRELVAGELGLEPPVALAVVVVLDHSLPGVVRVLVAARLGVGAERGGVEGAALVAGEAQAGLLAVHSRHPAEQVVERAVLHHQHDDGVERSLGRVGHPADAARLRASPTATVWPRGRRRPRTARAARFHREQGGRARGSGHQPTASERRHSGAPVQVSIVCPATTGCTSS